MCAILTYKDICQPSRWRGGQVLDSLCNKHLIPFLPGPGSNEQNEVSAAPTAKFRYLPQYYAILHDGVQKGLERATKGTAILNANYLAAS